MMSDSLPDIDEAKRYYGIGFDSYAILMYHPVTTEHDKISRNIKEVVDAVMKSSDNFLTVFPNNDHGSEIILNEYERFKSRPGTTVFPSLRFEYFLTFLKHAKYIIGNSSAGIREAGVYGVPSIDIGSRQTGRYSMDEIRNIQHVDENSAKILNAISEVQKYRTRQIKFGQGNSTELFMKILEDSGIWDLPLQKKFIDQSEGFL